MFHVVLHRPGIPQNTGNIGRLCVGLEAELHLVGPCGFDLDDRKLRRAGLDYWPHLSWRLHEDDTTFEAWLGNREPWLVTKHGETPYNRPAYRDGDVLCFGNENHGLPDAWHRRWPHRRIAIPIRGPIRSYNLANAVAMVLSVGRLKAEG